MGKSKTTKFRRPPFNAAGLPVDVEADDGDDGCPAAELLEKVRTPSKRPLTCYGNMVSLA